MAYLLDTNILLRLFAEDDPRHEEVKAAVNHLGRQGEPLHFALQNAAEFWNVATRPVDRNGFGYTPSEADGLLDLAERVAPPFPDHPAMYSYWRRLVREAGVSGVQVHDARLVAWMQAHGVTHVLTMNPDDFARYTDIAGITVVEPAQVARTSAGDDEDGRPVE